MTVANHFELLRTDGTARRGQLTTPHGVVRTPAFMPVGTLGAMKSLHWRDVRDAGADIVLGNTYHLMLRPGAERVASFGGLQKFTTWNGPMLTDSGGFQVMSLAQLRKVTEQGVTFRSHIDGAKFELTPERAIEIQRLLNSDIAMQLDECVRLPAGTRRYRPRDAVVAALGRALQARLRDGAGRLYAVRHRAGRRCAGTAPRQCTWADRYRLSWILRSAASPSANRRP